MPHGDTWSVLMFRYLCVNVLVLTRPAFCRRDAKPEAERTGKVRRAVEATFEGDFADGKMGLCRVFEPFFAGYQATRP